MNRRTFPQSPSKRGKSQHHVKSTQVERYRPLLCVHCLAARKKLQCVQSHVCTHLQVLVPYYLFISHAFQEGGGGQQLF